MTKEEALNILTRERVFPPARWIQQLLTVYPLLAITGVAWTIYSYVQAVNHRSDSTWFARSGAVLCLIGFLCFYRRLLRHDLRPRASRNTIDDSADAKEAEQIRHDDWATATGFVLTVVGTVIWAYGDLWIRGPHR